jgi:serine/threonine protein kinase/class 3 adenylate cyclase
MSLERYRLLAQLGAGPDGVAYRATLDDGLTTVVVCDLSHARRNTSRWERQVPRLRLAAELEHPSAIRVLDLGITQEPPYVVLEWAGTSTLATSVSGFGLGSDHNVIELLRDLAGALSAAHRLGLSHGRLNPGQVLLDGAMRPKLNFTGAQLGFPAAQQTTWIGGADDRDSEATGTTESRAADLFGLGSMIAWLLKSGSEGHDRESTVTRLDTGSLLGQLALNLLAADPADRPMAREVEEQLDKLSQPMDATGDWGEHGQTCELPTLLAQPGDPYSILTRGVNRAPSTDSSSLRLGRYRLLDKLGEGGQGVVYRALDPTDGSVVAIKILRTDRLANPTVLRRFRKEARVMAEVNNPNVVNLLEYNEEDGVPYLVLEFVAGDDVGRLLEERTRLDVPTALAIMAAVARGLAEAHERGIVHRDIKPSNILLLDQSVASRGSLGETAEFALDSTFDSDSIPQSGAKAATIQRTAVDTDSVDTTAVEAPRPRVKISDFGLARHVVDTESLALTAAGALLGTPHYMAPEQWTGLAIDPRTDVYAIGGTLFHILAGRPPFVAETRDALCAQHCNEAPPPLVALNPSVSEGVARVVERALAKRPEDRYIDAGAMLRDIESLLHGRPTDQAIHPRLPDCDPERVMQFEFRWELQSSPRQLWPLVTNTDRLDRAIGFAAVAYKTRYEPGRGVRTFTEGRKAGQIEVGEEHPYEWVEPRRMGVLREYSKGPFRWLVSTVELEPRPDGGTTLVHRLRLEPSSWKIRVGSRWGVGVGLRKSLERVYRRIDATVQSQRHRSRAATLDPFEAPVPLPGQARQRLERLLDRLVEKGIDAAVVERMGEYLTLGAAQEVARIRPLALAQRWQVDSGQVVAACLYGASEGLLELHWDLLCPVCRISCHVTDTLCAIAEHAHCEACHLDFQLDFANSVELIFKVHPEIRQADVGTYCIGGPAHSPHVFAQLRVAPGERMELELELPDGSYRLRGPQLPWSVDFQVRKAATSRRCEIELASAPLSGCVPRLRAGEQILTLSNGHSRELVVRVERTASRGDALTAARAMSLALFRELFPGELLAPGRLAIVSMVTFLVTGLDPDQADTLYQELGDARAFSVVHEHLQQLGKAIRDGGGAVVKTVGEVVLAAFSDVTAAVRTALDLVNQLERSKATRALRLRVGVHRGTTLAATLNDQLDYFGATARQAVGILRCIPGKGLVLTQAVAADPEVAALLCTRGLQGEVVPADLAGHPHVIRIWLGAVPAGTTSEELCYDA